MNILVSCTYYVNQFGDIMKENIYSNSFIDLDTRFINYLYFVEIDKQFHRNSLSNL